MNIRNSVFYSTAIFLASMSMVPASHALDAGGLVQPSLDRIQQSVEDHAERQIENRTERQIEQTIKQRAEQALQPLDSALRRAPAKLPDRLSILSADGSEAFADVRVEGHWRAVEGQWLVMLGEGELSQLNQPGIHIIDQTRLAELGLRVVRFRVDDDLDSRDALKRILPASLVERLDRNHIYRPEGEAGAGSAPQPMPEAACDSKVKIGMVDTAIQTDHQSFADAHIIQKHFLDSTALASPFREPEAHGTAVASLLVGQGPNQSAAQLPGATLINASVFYSRKQLASGATLMHLIKGLNWLVSQHVDLINISMAGPDNRLLARVIERVSAAGIPLVAAVGNDGPAAPPLYPAAYPDVIGVTAVNRRHLVYRWANQGNQVDFAADGVDVEVADSGGGFTQLSGTSVATPRVTARLACRLSGSKAPLQDLVNQLARQAVDLGERGRDPVYGYGFLAVN